MRKTLVTPEYYNGIQEWYIEVIECPKCNGKNPAQNKFCGNCGVPFKMTTEVLRLSGRLNLQGRECYPIIISKEQRVNE